MSFHFRLKPLLTVRISERRLCEQAAAVARNEHAALAAACDQLNQQRQDLIHQIRLLNESQILDVARTRLLHEQSVQFDGEIRQLQAKMSLATAKVAKATEALLQANKQVEALEKLEQRQYGEFRTKQSAAELRELDDLSSRQFRQQ